MTIDEAVKNVNDGFANASDGFKKMQIVLMISIALTAIAILIIALKSTKQNGKSN